MSKIDVADLNIGRCTPKYDELSANIIIIAI